MISSVTLNAAFENEINFNRIVSLILGLIFGLLSGFSSKSILSIDARKLKSLQGVLQLKNLPRHFLNTN